MDFISLRHFEWFWGFCQIVVLVDLGCCCFRRWGIVVFGSEMFKFSDFTHFDQFWSKFVILVTFVDFGEIHSKLINFDKNHQNWQNLTLLTILIPPWQFTIVKQLQPHSTPNLPNSPNHSISINSDQKSSKLIKIHKISNFDKNDQNDENW